VDLDPVDRLDAEADESATHMLAGHEPAFAPRPAERAASSAGTRELLLVKLVALAVAVAVAAYGIETERAGVAIIGLAASALVALVMALGVRRSERACQELHRASERLRRRNAELDAFQAAVVQGFALIDERTHGRLSELVEEAGDEFAELIDDALDDPSEDAR
jgi:Flp pilus assembly protein TadB